MKLRAILFDLDDTLIDSQTIYRKAERRALSFLQARLALTLSEQELSLAFSDARAKTKARLPLGHSSSRNRVLYFKLLVEALVGKSIPEVTLATFAEYELALYEKIELKSADALWKLRASLPFALITNEVARTQLQKIVCVDPHAELFSEIIVSEELGFEKPAPQLFLEALKRLRVSASETLMIGDDFDADIVGATEVGIPAWWIQDEFSSSLPAKLKNPELLVGVGPLNLALEKAATL